MASFSDRSHSRLASCDPRLQRVLDNVVRNFDCTILEGHRDEARQNHMVDEGKSQVRWPDGKHNTVPSLAVDVCPYPVVWDDRERQTLFAGYVLATAKSMGVDLRWGGDWSMDFQVKDNRFDDLVHFELVDEAD